MSRAQSIAHALGGAKKTPAGYICRCPAHEDKNASLSLKDHPNGGVIVNCLSGCPWDDIKPILEQRGLLDRPKPPAKRADKYENVRFFVYRDIVGNTLARKCKPPKPASSWQERWDGSSWVSGLAGLQLPLYNLQAVTQADIVYLCEGEKDAETLIAAGLVATTNSNGASHWAPYLSDQLKGKCVVILPDNDEAGRKRVAKVSKAIQGLAREIRVFVPDGVPEKGDVTDWVNNGGNPADIFQRSTMVAQADAPKKAPRSDYYELFESYWKGPRRCLFSGKLMYWDPNEELWNPCVNQLEIIKSEALELNETRGPQFIQSRIQPHFTAYVETKTPELLVDIPTWDGQDRIAAMAGLLHVKTSQGISIHATEDLLKEWCSLMFQRLHDPMIQNRILILQGGQGIGKDTWTSMLVDGLGQFSIPLNVVGDDKDTFLTLSDGLVIKISEYDKTSRTEVSTLKDIITTPMTRIREAYDKDRKVRKSRVSFISSANVDDLLRDHTGSRRYLILELEKIEYAYAGWTKEQTKSWQMQCLAQMERLGQERYAASEDSWRQMRDYLDSKTPEDPAQEMVDAVSLKLRDIDMTLSREAVRLPQTDPRIHNAILQISRETGIKPRGVKGMVRNKIGKYGKAGGKRFWVWEIPPLAHGDQNGAAPWQEE